MINKSDYFLFRRFVLLTWGPAAPTLFIHCVYTVTLKMGSYVCPHTRPSVQFKLLSSVSKRGVYSEYSENGSPSSWQCVTPWAEMLVNAEG